MISCRMESDIYILGKNGLVYEFVEAPDDPEDAWLEPMGGYGVADLWSKPEERMQ